VWEEEEGSDDMGCEEEEELLLLLLLLPVNIFNYLLEIRVENGFEIKRSKN
jgi:hypothetical protein